MAIDETIYSEFNGTLSEMNDSLTTKIQTDFKDKLEIIEQSLVDLNGIYTSKEWREDLLDQIQDLEYDILENNWMCRTMSFICEVFPSLNS